MYFIIINFHLYILALFIYCLNDNENYFAVPKGKNVIEFVCFEY